MTSIPIGKPSSAAPVTTDSPQGEVDALPLDRLALIESRLRANTEMIQMADRKAQMLLRLVLGLFMIAFVGVPPTVMSLQTFYGQGGWKMAIFIGVVLLYFGCAACLLMAMVRIIAVIRPRIAPHQPDAPPSTFFGSVAHMSRDQFRDMMMNIEAEDAVDDLVDQAYQTARIAQSKFRVLRQAINWMLGGGLVGIIFAEILLISTGLMWQEPPAAESTPADSTPPAITETFTPPTSAP